MFEGNSGNEGPLRFNTLIRARDKTNKQPGPLFRACVPSDLNPICLFLVLLKTRAEQPMAGPLWALEEAAAVVAVEVGAHKLSIVQTMSVWAYGFRHI